MARKQEAKVSRRNAYLTACSIVLAAGLLFVKILVAPPVSIAAMPLTLDPEQMTLTAGKGLQSYDDNYQTHLGVLDTLERR